VVIYFRNEWQLSPEYAPGEKSFHSTGENSKMRAVDLIYRKLQEGEKCEQNFREYADPFFIW